MSYELFTRYKHAKSMELDTTIVIVVHCASCKTSSGDLELTQPAAMRDIERHMAFHEKTAHC